MIAVAVEPLCNSEGVGKVATARIRGTTRRVDPLAEFCFGATALLFDTLLSKVARSVPRWAKVSDAIFWFGVMPHVIYWAGDCLYMRPVCKFW